MRGGSFGAFPFFIVMEQEVWKDVPNYEGLYQVSNLGRFASFINMGNHKADGKRRIKQVCKRKNGYYIVTLTKDKETKYEYIHRLVAKAFCDNPNGYNEIDHIDSNKENNTYKNLKWVTHKENINNPHTISKRNKIAKERGFAVAQYDLFDNHIRDFRSLREVERIYPNINRSRVKDCAAGLINSVCGYKWKLINKK